MSTRIDISNSREKLAWTWVVIMLSAERAVPAFEIIGMPWAICAEPEDLHRAFEDIARDGLGTWPGLSYTEATLEGTLNGKLALLSQRYGMSAMAQFVAWATQHFIDFHQVAWLSDSAITFNLFASHLLIPRRDIITLPVSVRRREFVRYAVLAYFGPSYERRVKRSLAVVRRSSSSQLELQVSAMENATVANVTEQRINLLTHIERHATLHRAHRVWSELEGRLPTADLSALRGWASEQYEAIVG